MVSVPFTALFESPFIQLKKLVFFSEKENTDNSLEAFPINLTGLKEEKKEK